MGDIGKVLIVVGAVVIIFGVVLIGAGRLHLPLGRLPGDFVYRGKRTVFYFPLATSIVISIALTLIFWLLGHLRR
jgi:hypothetical protein